MKQHPSSSSLPHSTNLPQQMLFLPTEYKWTRKAAAGSISGMTSLLSRLTDKVNGLVRCSSFVCARSFLSVYLLTGFHFLLLITNIEQPTSSCGVSNFNLPLLSFNILSQTDNLFYWHLFENKIIPSKCLF